MVCRLYQEQINIRKQENKYRSLPKQNQKEYLDFSSNDYLSLSHNKLLIDAAKKAADELGVGAAGSRLLMGQPKIVTEFESAIASCKGTEEAIIMQTGFQCNISVLSCLTDRRIIRKEALVFFDRLNHASLYQAVFLSNAKLIRYKHNDVEHLTSLLDKYKNDEKPKFIITETIFGMDGDIAPIAKIADLSKEHNAFLYLDEAHATGVFGENGYGLSTKINLKNVQHIIMGTFSKALGCSGAYIACSKLIKDYLINFCPGFIYSTASSPMVIGAAFAAWQLLSQLENERIKLQENGNYLRKKCKNMGLNIGDSATHIVPIILGSIEKTEKAYNILQNHGIKVSYVRPPTVPLSRLRIALTIAHSKDDIDKLIKVLGLL